jgi:hypothetical protein
MRGLLRSAVLVALPHGGQRGSRSNALGALRAVQVDLAEQAEAARVLGREEHPHRDRQQHDREQPPERHLGLA